MINVNTLSVRINHCWIIGLLGVRRFIGTDERGILSHKSIFVRLQGLSHHDSVSFGKTCFHDNQETDGCGMGDVFLCLE